MDENDDDGYNLFKSLIEEHSQYYAKQKINNKDGITASSSLSSLVLGSDGSGGSIIDEMMTLSIDEMIDDGTECCPKIIRCCPLEITFLSSITGQEERSMFGQQQNNIHGSSCLSNFFNFSNHLKNIFQHRPIDYDLNGVLYGIRVIALIWTLVSAIYIEGMEHNKNKLHFFWCGVKNIHNNNSTNLGEMKFQKPIPSRLLGRGTALSFNIFLFLSSYILSQQLIKEYRDVGFISITKFYLKRLLKMVPCCGIAFIIYHFFDTSPQGNDNCNPITNIFFINNFFPDQISNQCYDNSWILSVFLQLYIVLPWLVLTTFIRVRSSINRGENGDNNDDKDYNDANKNHLGFLHLLILVILNVIFRLYLQYIIVNDDINQMADMRCKLSVRPYFDFSPFLIGIIFSYREEEEKRIAIIIDEDRRHDAMIGSLSPVLKPSISPQRIKKLSKALVDSNFVLSKSMSDVNMNRSRAMKTNVRSISRGRAPSYDSIISKGTDGNKILSSLKAVSWIYVLISLILFIVVIMFNPTPDNSSIKDDRSNGTLYLIIFAIEPAVCALFFGIVISYAKSHVNGFIFKFLNLSMFVPLSNSSFTMLLLHKIILSLSLKFKIFNNEWLDLLSYFCFVFISGILLTVLIERPFRDGFNACLIRRL